MDRSFRAFRWHSFVCTGTLFNQSKKKLNLMSEKISIFKRAWFFAVAFVGGGFALCVLVVVLAKAQFGLDEALGPKLDAGFIATYPDVVQGMLQIADLKPGDIVYDLGCGDGRIVIAAAKQYGVKGVGIDLNPKRVGESIFNAQQAGVEKLVRFEVGNFFEVDFSEATVVMLYLPADINIRLRPYIWRQLKVGSRVVSHDNGMGPELPADKSIPVGHRGVFMWTVTEEQKRLVEKLDPPEKKD